jgi:hypothetical protein
MECRGCSTDDRLVDNMESAVHGCKTDEMADATDCKFDAAAAGAVRFDLDREDNSHASYADCCCGGWSITFLLELRLTVPTTPYRLTTTTTMRPQFLQLDFAALAPSRLSQLAAYLKSSSSVF